MVITLGEKEGVRCSEPGSLSEAFSTSSDLIANSFWSALDKRQYRPSDCLGQDEHGCQEDKDCHHEKNQQRYKGCTGQLD